MLDEMNIQSKEMRDLINSKDIPTKTNMLLQFMKSGESDPSQKSKGPQSSAEFAEELSRTDMSDDDTLSLMLMLRVNLSTKPLSWIQDFAELSVPKLTEMTKTWIQTNKAQSPVASKIIHECIKCMKSVMDSQKGLRRVLSDLENIEVLVECLDPTSPQVMNDAVRLLAATSLCSLSKVVQCMSKVARKRGHPRFARIIEGLQPHQPLYLKLSCLLFSNAVVTGSDDFKLRTYLRDEFYRSGLQPLLQELKDIDHPSIKVQLSVFEDSRDDDIAELQNLLHIVEVNFETADEAYSVLSRSLKDTPAEYYFKGILHILLIIDGDVIRRKCFFQCLEEVISQIALQKNGIDYDFNIKRIELNMEPILEGMVNKTLVDEVSDRLAKMEKQYTQQVTLKNELEAKLALTTKNFESKIKALEGEITTNSSALVERDKVIDSLNSKVATLSKEMSSIPKGGGVPSAATSGIIEVPSPPTALPPPPPMEAPGPPPPPPPMGAPGPPPPPPPMGAPGPPPPPPPMGIPGPPQPPGGIPAPSTSSVPVKKKYKPAAVTKRLNWTQIPYSKLTNDSLWKCVDETKYEKSEIFEQIIQLFATKTKAGSGAIPFQSSCVGVSFEQGGSKKTKEPAVLDSKSVQNISIFRGSFKCSLDEIKRRLLMYDQAIITETFVENLLKFLPPAETLNVLLEHKNEYEDLPEAEQFLLKVAEIPDLELRLRFMSIMSKFKEQMNDVKPQIACVISSCEEIKGSDKFKELLQLILLFGNYMNSGSRNEGTHGFEISFLTRLCDTKTQDNSLTFMHFLAQCIDQFYPELMGVEKEIANATAAMKVSKDVITKNITQLSSSLETIEKSLPKFEKPSLPDDKFGPMIKSFWSKATEELNVVQEMLAKMNELYDSVGVYFVFNTAKLEMEEFFGIVSTFLGELEKSISDNNKRKDKAEKDRINKERKEQDRLKKEQKKFNNVTPNQIGNKKIPIASSTVDKQEEGVIDGLLQALESGSAFQQHKNMAKKKKTIIADDLRKERTRTMNLNAKAMFSQMLASEKQDSVNAEEELF